MGGTAGRSVEILARPIVNGRVWCWGRMHSDRPSEIRTGLILPEGNLENDDDAVSIQDERRQE